jgi:hypothetical protein
MHSRPSDSQDFGAAKRAKLDVVRVDGVSSKVTASAAMDGQSSVETYIFIHVTMKRPKTLLQH